MTTIRRVLILIGLTLAVTVAAAIPASAAFQDTYTARTTVGTGTVAAPASVTVNDYCGQTANGGYYDANGTWVTTYYYWYDATVTWPASTTARGVTGYRVMAHLNNGTSVVMAETDAVNRTVNARVDRGYLNYQPRVSVITLTSYGWTAETPRTAVLAC
ncbi:hypothetical protein [Blastococcus haudaquaticus]|uniref:Secreted protein n=1 Tax=Blastococcus haudaquaticus TaxID=1938745 RepID=A0A286H8F2_9ACTN|nr:hypothetical protein [Blastococcus haudaquaticus]SOE04080.1 hypothetical protein SAMN06272739_4450 [Blastococcus haudaquaticus]